MLDFVKGIMRSSAGRIDEMQIPWLLTDPSEQFWFADALNLEIHDPFKKGSAKNGGPNANFILSQITLFVCTINYVLLWNHAFRVAHAFGGVQGFHRWGSRRGLARKTHK
jgi:hypothetical protein